MPGDQFLLDPDEITAALLEEVLDDRQMVGVARLSFRCWSSSRAVEDPLYGVPGDFEEFRNLPLARSVPGQLPDQLFFARVYHVR